MYKVNSRIQLMKEEKMSLALFKLGMPIVITMLVTALYNVVDAWFVSGLGTTEVAAVFLCLRHNLIPFYFSKKDLMLYGTIAVMKLPTHIIR